MSEPYIPVQRSTGDLARIFNYRDGLTVRSVLINDEHWFVAADVCDALDLSNVTAAVKRLDEDERQTLTAIEFSQLSGGALTSIDSMGRPRPAVLVNEPGLYALILRSDKEDARKFKRWVTHVVLPQIRKNGGYINPRATDAQLEHLAEDIEQRRVTLTEAKLKMLNAGRNIVDGAWLDAKARHVIAQGLGEEPEIDPSTRPLTVGEYLEGRGLKGAALRSLSTKFGRQIKAVYRDRFHADPPAVDRFVDGALRPVAGYTEAHRALFDEVYATLTAGSIR